MSPLAGLRHFLASHTEMSSANARGGDGDVYPPVPSSLNADSHELRDFTNEHSEYAIAANTAPQYTPYLGLRARLSQAWINKWTILLLLVLCRVLLAVKNMDKDIANAKSDALSACTSVENVGSAMASMPHYLSLGVNALAADGVTAAINGLMDMLMMSITGVEEIVLFVINMMTSMYVCLITLVVSGALHAAITMIEDAGAFMNKTIGGLTSTMSSDLSSFQNDLNNFLSDVGKVTGLLGGTDNVPTINLTAQINALNDIQIDPTTLDQDLTNLSNHIPDFAQVQNFTNNAISIPFEEVKKLINESVGSYTFDKSVFPVAQKQALTFCSDNNTINVFFDGLSDTAHLARKVFIVVMIVLAILACIPMAYRELWRWRTMQQRAKLLQKDAFDSLDVLYIASRPYTSTAGIKAASKFKSSKRQILTRWTIAYATSVPALFVLALGIAGLFSVLCQYILIKTIEKEVPALTAEVSDFAGTVVAALDNASEAWAASANSVINSTNVKINDDVFGWVKTATSAINDTLNEFVDGYTSVLTDTFGGTILYDPISDAINCLIGLKVAGIEKGLTWVSDNAHVTFPEFANNTFSLGAAASIANSSSADSFLSSPDSTASDDITGAVVDMTDAIMDGLHDELIIALVLVGLWLFVALIGVTRAIICMFGRDKTRGEGGAAYTGDFRPPLTPRSPQNLGNSTFVTARGDGAEFPAFDAPSAHPDGHSPHDDDTWAAVGLGVAPPPFEEKIEHKHAPQRIVGVSHAHVRSSSYGFVTGDEKS